MIAVVSVVTAVWLVLASVPASAQDVSLSTNVGGITIGGAKPNWSTGFGSVNGLGAGVPGAHQTVLSTSGGVFYTSPYDIATSGVNGFESCSLESVPQHEFRPPLDSAGVQLHVELFERVELLRRVDKFRAPSDVIGLPGDKKVETVTRYLAVYVSNQNGAAIFSGTDSALITLLVSNAKDNSLLHTYTLALNNPTELVQSAVRLTLGDAPGGAAIAPGSDFNLAFGNVNGLGISPSAGLTTAAVSGGELYSTPYLVQPSFAGLSSTTATLKMYVSTDFIHPGSLELRDSSSGASFSAISKTAGAQTTLTTSASSGSALTRYIGLFVSASNGAGVFTGSDNATVTFTLMVP